MIQIMRWHKHQHYHNRRYPPLWIKVFPKLLDDPLFMHLSRDAQLLLLKLWLITSQAKADGSLAMNLIDIAWRLRMGEEETYRIVMELAASVDEDGNPQWLTWAETPLDEVLKQRLDHESDRSRPSVDVSADVADETEEEKNHQLALEKSRSVATTGESSVGLDDSHRDSFKNENENTGLDPKTDDDEEEVVEDRQDTQSIPASIPVSHGTWLTDYATPWEKRFGAASFDYGRAAKPMKRLEMEHGRPAVMKNWEFYCSVIETEYANPQTFASKFAAYDPDNQQQSTLTPTGT